MNFKRIISSAMAVVVSTALPFSVNNLSISAQESSDVIKTADGMTCQILDYSDPAKPGYSNADSDILRFAVYVETDHDTDLDGKPDLVKAFVQLPRPAAEGKYRAPVIYEANPYAAGMTMGSFTSAQQKLTDQDIKSTPEKRVPAGAMSTMELSRDADASDWNYKFASDYNELYYYSNIHSYDYFLVRGFAFVTCSGLGTRGSEGIQVCGSVPEREAFKAVVEWLHGDRTAYTDTESNITVSADWSSGKVGMTGLSYTGTLAYEVATTGVEGLETIVPVAGISSWYEFSNSQGISTYLKYNYTSELSDTCSSRFFDDKTGEAFENYQKYRSYAEASQIALQGDYGDYWREREYSGADKIKATTLIVEGLNDHTVRQKQFDLMWKAFVRSGIEPKALLHQNEHVTPFDDTNNTDIMVGDHTYTELLNLWFSHYLFGIENGIEKMQAVTAQSNIDGNFYGYDSWDAARTAVIAPENKGETTVTAAGASECNDILMEKVFVGSGGDNAALWKTEVTSPMTIEGAAEITLRIKCSNIDALNTSVAAALVDTADSDFPVFSLGYDSLPTEKLGKLGYVDGKEQADLVKWVSSPAGKKLVATGIMDLKNPEADYTPWTAAERSKPVRSGEWHEYKLYLQPTLYNVQKGHRLELYIIPYVNGHFDFDITSIFTAEEIKTRYGCDADGLALHNRDYSFTIDNEKSFAVLPVTDTPEQLLDKDTGEESSSSEASEIQQISEQSSPEQTSTEQSSSGSSEEAASATSEESRTSAGEESPRQTSGESSGEVNTGETPLVIPLTALIVISAAAVILSWKKGRRSPRESSR